MGPVVPLALSAAFNAVLLLVVGEEAAIHILYFGVAMDAFTTGAGIAAGVPEAGLLARHVWPGGLPGYFPLEAAILLAMQRLVYTVLSRYGLLEGWRARASVAVPSVVVWTAALGNYLLLVESGVLPG